MVDLKDYTISMDINKAGIINSVESKYFENYN